MAKDEVLVISGCSSGFGRNLVLQGLKAGLRVVATARKLSDIKDLEEAGATCKQLDVTWDAERIRSFADEVIREFGHVDYLVNNSGTGGVKTVEEADDTFFEWVFQTNYFGHVKMTKAFLPYMRKRKSGTIVFISSRNADVGLVTLSAYASSKAALSVFSDTLRKEGKYVGVRVMAVQPGPFRTPMLPRAKGARSELYPEVDELMQKYTLTAGNEPGNPEKGAERIIDVMMMEGELPERFVLGQAAFDMTSAKLEQRKAELLKWKDQSLGVDYET